jgi:F-type H+-transporting ATPase subunit b
MESLIATFHIDVKLIIAQLINFAVVFAVLYWFVFKPLGKTMRDRTTVIEKGLADAKESAQSLEQAQREAKSFLATARVEAQEIVKNASDEAERRKTRMIIEAKDEVNEIVSQGKNQLANEKLKMVEEAKIEIVNLVSSAAERILPGLVTPSIDKQLIEKTIKELEH